MTHPSCPLVALRFLVRACSIPTRSHREHENEAVCVKRVLGVCVNVCVVVFLCFLERVLVMVHV
jgi:hypothetical protein